MIQGHRRPLMAQNALRAAQSLGLGVYIGGICNNPAEVSEVLGLPHQVIPLFGLCLGHPAQRPEQTAAAAPGAGGAREPLSCHPGPRPAGPVRRADPTTTTRPAAATNKDRPERADRGIRAGGEALHAGIPAVEGFCPK